MIKIENTEVVGWESAIRGARNPYDSWDRSDSHSYNGKYYVGENDLGLMKKLAKAGTDHGKFMRMIVVYFDVVAPLYYLKELDTYKVGTVCDSCSTMHRIQAKKFGYEDFSCEKLIGDEDDISEYATLFGSDGSVYDVSSKEVLGITIDTLNIYRDKYNETKDKKYWWQMIQLLPSSYNQRRTYEMNYAVLKNIYRARKEHRLDEWRTFCGWIESLPYSELITDI